MVTNYKYLFIFTSFFFKLCLADQPQVLEPSSDEYIIQNQMDRLTYYSEKAKELFEKIKKSKFTRGLIAGAVAQVTIETIREILPEYPGLYGQTGLCRDRLTEAAILTTGTALYYYLDNKSLSLKGLAGVLTGSLGTASARKILGLDPHKLRKIT